MTSHGFSSKFLFHRYSRKVVSGWRELRFPPELLSAVLYRWPTVHWRRRIPFLWHRKVVWQAWRYRRPHRSGIGGRPCLVNLVERIPEKGRCFSWLISGTKPGLPGETTSSDGEHQY